MEPNTGSKQTPSSGSKQTPSSGSKQTPSSGSKQTPSSDSTQPPTSDSMQTPSSDSTQPLTSDSIQTPISDSTQPPTSGYPYPPYFPYPGIPGGYPGGYPQTYPGGTPDGTDTPKPPKRQGWTDEEKRALKAKITDQAAVLTFCLKTAQEHFGDYCRTEESLINLAIALYTGAVKRN